jgi:hypothetical protein
VIVALQKSRESGERMNISRGGEPVEGLLDRALASMENLRESADTMAQLLDELLK